MYRKNAWLKYKDQKEVMDFAEGYKSFLSVAKSESPVQDPGRQVLPVWSGRHRVSL